MTKPLSFHDLISAALSFAQREHGIEFPGPDTVVYVPPGKGEEARLSVSWWVKPPVIRESEEAVGTDCLIVDPRVP